MRTLLIWLSYLLTSTAVAQKNAFENASFETGRSPWISLVDSSPFWKDFTVTTARAHTGNASAHLALTSIGASEKSTRVYGVVRDLPDLETLPQTLGGHYLVENWRQGTRNQYLQVVVILFPGPNGFAQFPGSPETPLQLAIVLGGIDRPPFGIANRRFLFPNPGKMKTDVWIAFQLDLHGAFRAAWGEVPTEFSKMRILYEARFDGWSPAGGDIPVGGDVYYDDLFLR